MAAKTHPPLAAAAKGVQPRGELDLIRLIQRRSSAQPGGLPPALRLGIGDDCAILRPGSGEEVVVTTDLSLEGRHFRRDWHSAQAIGHRTLARGLSDLAAMGARPLAAFLSMALPRDVAQDASWLDRFLDGFLALAAQASVPLAGGDTAESPSDHVIADVVLLGVVPQGKALRRDGARVGDRIFVTGALGGAAAQLADLIEASVPHQPSPQHPGPDQPHHFPDPRLAAGQILLEGALATAAIDLSDGLSTDLYHLCVASGVCAAIEAARLPLHGLLSARGPQAALPMALHGGEDYELLFTAPDGKEMPRTLGSIPVTEIGRIVTCEQDRPRVLLRESNGEAIPLAPGGWEHLR